MYDYNSQQENDRQKERLHQLASDRKTWEERKMKQGWRYMPDESATVPTWIFASPEQQKVIRENNKIHRINKLSERQKILASHYQTFQNEMNYEKTVRTSVTHG